MYVYKRTEFSPYCLYTVEHYDPKSNNWIPESDHDTKEAAAERTAWLNGSRPTLPDSVKEALNTGNGSYHP